MIDRGRERFRVWRSIQNNITMVTIVLAVETEMQAAMLIKVVRQEFFSNFIDLENQNGRLPDGQDRSP